jgi:hypothetical protein
MKKQTIAITLFWVGFLIAVSVAIIGTGSLMSVLRTLTRLVFLVLGWVFVLAGEYQSRRSKTALSNSCGLSSGGLGRSFLCA